MSENKSQAESLREELSSIRNVVLYPSFGSIIAFNIKDKDSNTVSQILDDHEICTRSGLHCAPSAHVKLGTLRQGCVRISLSYFNTEREIRTFSELINSIF